MNTEWERKQTEKLVKEIFETYPFLNGSIEKTLES